MNLEFVNGVAEIEPLKFQGLDRETMFLGLLDAFGASVSGMPRDYESVSYSEKWEILDPEQVTNPESLPLYWRVVYEFHNAPDRTDCVTLRFRYAHTPRNVVPEYPRVPCKGIFCISEENVDLTKLTERDLIHVGNEIELEVAE